MSDDKFSVSDETIALLNVEIDDLIPDIKTIMKERKKLQTWIDNSFETIFMQVVNPDNTVKMIGLCHFELMVQVCRKFNLNTGFYRSPMYKKCLHLSPMIRHIFEVKVPEDLKFHFKDSVRIEQ